jgi:hypothetical protein
VSNHFIPETGSISVIERVINLMYRVRLCSFDVALAGTGTL